jgi:hypothetical protein
VTGHIDTGILLDEPGYFLDAAVVGIDATAMEDAARGQVNGCRDFAFEF